MANPLQDLTTMMSAQIEQRCHKMWYPMGRLPLERWLLHKQSKQDACRLKACGNISMPEVTRLALHLMCAHARAGGVDLTV